MTRFELQDWMDYIEGRISTEQQMIMEEKLLHSDEALQLYLQAFEKSRFQLPKLYREDFTDALMEQITSLEESAPSDPSEHQLQLANNTPRPNRWIHHPIFHYTVAAAITMILFASGLFEQMLQVIPSEDLQTGTITSTLMDHATSLLDALKPE